MAIAPLVVARWWWRGRREPLYRHAIGERFGRYTAPLDAGSVWIHAVSLGETRAAAALIDALRAQRPGLRLLLTHGTATGREAGRALLRGGDAQCWLPYDLPGAVERFFAQARPAVGVLMETEIWPGLIEGARAAGVPLLLANARLSERSLRRGRRAQALLGPAIAALDRVLAQTESDAQRLRAAGARRVEVMGNLKFDAAPAAALLERGRAWAASSARPTVLAASTREGEEAALLAAWRRARPAARLLVVPRHPQRFDEVAALIEQAGFRLSRRSGWGEGAPAEAADVWLGDSVGEMPAYYGCAQVALLGGSFAPLGGQNLIEAAACGCPVVMGPYTFNFAQAAEQSLEAGAASRVADLDAAVDRALSIAGDAVERAAMSEHGLGFAAAHRGAAARMACAVIQEARDLRRS
ncbi:MAG TPA: 3-deoxy-D-manno-octulosonic acid transferase [Methylibium sp.]|uniref:3-deoxy-D-manno-octulosonic acid transferase n=1 Tax=Methylibium sp. TaxID=2067992 RepID=UPI002DBFE314|nr:3-deoxy-D-manno-octulosonic acid transferase [Methylibium sp.]HEU4459338.1 3-deoxy-D-manno-octulosonic acid transferase [Methylibium sp.]